MTEKRVVLEPPWTTIFRPFGYKTLPADPRSLNQHCWIIYLDKKCSKGQNHSILSWAWAKMTFFPQLYFSGRTRTLHVSIRLQRWSFEPCHMRARRKTGRNISSIVQNKDISYIHILYWLFNDKLSSSVDKHIQKMILHSVWKWFSKSLIGIFTKSCKGQFVVKWDFLSLFQTQCDTYANFRYTKKEAWVVHSRHDKWTKNSWGMVLVADDPLADLYAREMPLFYGFQSCFKEHFDMANALDKMLLVYYTRTKLLMNKTTVVVV